MYIHTYKKRLVKTNKPRGNQRHKLRKLRLCVCLYTLIANHMYIYIYIYIERERERFMPVFSPVAGPPPPASSRSSCYE